MTQLKTIILSGELGKKFGREHQFAVISPAEAIRALCANFKEFREHLMASEDRGVRYRVVARKNDVGLSDLHNPTGSAPIRIVPVLAGAKAGVGEFLLGAALIAGAFMTGGATLSIEGGLAFSGLAGQMAFGVGMALALGGIAQMLAPSPQNPAGNQASYDFGGPINTTKQGVPVPVGYGRLIVGSAVISAGISVDQVPTTQTGVSNLNAVVSNNAGQYILYAYWDAAGLAIAYDVVVQGSGYGPVTLPRTNADQIYASVPGPGPYTVTVKPVEKPEPNLVYGPSASCVTSNA